MAYDKEFSLNGKFWGQQGWYMDRWRLRDLAGIGVNFTAESGGWSKPAGHPPNPDRARREAAVKDDYLKMIWKDPIKLKTTLVIARILLSELHSVENLKLCCIELGDLSEWKEYTSGAMLEFMPAQKRWEI